MSTTTNILITGATGYIGGTVLDRLLSHPSAVFWSFTALVRSKEKAAKLKEAGVTAIIADLTDSDLIEKAASEADVAFTMAASGHMESTTAMLRGLKKRFEATGKAPIVINASGTAVLVSDTVGKGKEPTGEEWDDMDVTRFETISPTASPRPVDLEILKADKEGYIKSYILLVPVVFGLPQSRFIDAGIQNSHSMLVMFLGKIALQQGKSRMVGEGKNIWSIVEVNELADAFVILYDAIIAGTNQALGHGSEGYYFTSHDELRMYEFTKEIGSALVKLGKAESAEPVSFTQEELDTYLGPFATVIGSTLQTKSNRTKALGWNPKKTAKDFLESILPEIKSLVQ